MENRKERYESFRAKAAGFLAKNGFTLVLGLSLLVIGIAAAATLIPAPAEAPEPSPTAAAASQSRDETLQTVTMTPVPAVAPKPVEAEMPSPDPAPTAEPAAAASAPKAAVKAAPPVEGEILWGYAVDSLLYSTTLEQWTTHPGVDIGAKAGTEVRAAALTAEDVAGLQLFGGMQDRAPDGTPENYYMALFTGGGLKQTRGVYEKLDGRVRPMLCPVRPYLENNALLRVEGLACLGQIGEDGVVSGGEESIPGLRFAETPGKKRRKRR